MVRRARPEPARRSLPARIVRALLYTVLVLLVGLVSAVPAALLVASTDWGREQIRRLVEARLGDLVNGTVTVGRLTGSPLGRLHLEGLTVRDADGRTVLAARGLALDWDPLALLGRRFHARSVVLDALVVQGALGADGTLDLAHLLRDGDASPAGPSRWTVALDRLQGHDGVVLVPAGAGALALVAVQLDAAVELEGDRLDLAIAALEATDVVRGLPVRLAGHLVRTPGLLVASGLDVHAGASRVQVPLAIWDPKGGALTALVDGTVAAADLARLAPAAALAGDLALAGAVTRAGAEQAFVALLGARALGGQLGLIVALDPGARTVQGGLHARDLVAPGALPAQLDLDLQFASAGFAASTARGHLALDARGVLAGQRLDRAHLGLVLAGGVIGAEFEASAPGAHAGLRATLRLGPDLVVETARLHAEVAELGTLRAMPPDLHGAVTVDVTASGPLLGLRARGTVVARQLALASVRAAALRVAFDVAQLPWAPVGNARLEVDGAALGGAPLGRLRAGVVLRGPRVADVTVTCAGPGATYAGELAARVTWDPAALRVALAGFEVTARGLAFRGSGGGVRLERGGAVTLDHLAATSAAGRVWASGTFTALSSGRGAGRLALRVQGGDLARLRAALAPAAPALSGTVDLDATVGTRGHEVAVEGTITLGELVVRADLPAVDVALRLGLEAGRLRTTGSLRAHTTPMAVDLDLDLAVPRDLTDRAAWGRIELLDARHGGSLRFRDVELAVVARALGRPVELDGLVAGTLALPRGTGALALDLAGHGLVTPRLPGSALDLTLRGTWTHEALRLAGALGLAGRGELTIEASAAAGPGALLGGLDLLGVGLVAHVEAKTVPLEALQAALGLTTALTGSLDVVLELTGTARAPRVAGQLVLAHATVGGAALEHLTADLTADGRRVGVRLTARQDGPGVLELDASLDREDAAASHAHLRAEHLDLAFLTALSSGRGSLFATAGGTLDADFVLAGGAAFTPQALRGRIQIKNGRFYVPSSGPLEHLELAATVDAGHLVVERLTGTSGGGTVTGKADAHLVGLAPGDLAVELQLTDVPVLLGALVARVTTHGKLVGGARPGGLQLVATLEDTRIRVLTERRSGAGLGRVHGNPDVLFIDGSDGRAAPGPVTRSPGGTGALPRSLRVQGPDLRLEVITLGSIEVTGKDLVLFVRQHLIVTLRDGLATLSGGLEAEQGFVQLFGARWDVETANVSFDPRGAPDPRLDLQLSRELRTTTVHVSVTGTLSQPKLELRAEPGSYDQAQILAWVLGGSQDDAGGAAPALGGQAVGVASTLLLGQVQDQIRALIPLDVLAVTLGEGADTQTTRVQVGKWLSDTLFLGYRARLNSPDATRNQSEAAIEWRFARRWFLDAFYGDRGAGGADVLWSKKY